MRNITYVTKEGLKIMRMSRNTGRGYHAWAWYLRRWESGKPVYFNLGRDLKEAAEKACKIDGLIRSGTKTLQEVKEMFCARQCRRASLSGMGKVEDVVKALHEEHGLLGLSKSSAVSYGNSLVKILREGLSGSNTPKTNEQILGEPCSVLTATVLRSFKRGRYEAADKCGDELKKASALRSANKDLRQAKAAFSDKAMKIYDDRGIRLPEMDGWRDVSLFGGLNQKYRLPTAALIRRVMQRIRELPQGSDLWLAAYLAAHIGMRRNEIIFARWSWFRPSNSPRVEIARESDFTPKRTHERAVEVEPSVFDAVYGCKKPGAVYVLSGDEAARREVVDDTLVGFLRKAGVRVQKPVHELRKWFGSWTAAERNPRFAQRQLGHESYMTTEKHYSDVGFPDELRDLWKPR